MRYRFIEDHRRRWPVALQCAVLGVSRSGYYGWRTRSPSASRQRREALAVEIRQVHAESRAVYGSPRVHAELAARGRVCDRKTVAKLMKQQGIRSRSRKRFRPRTTDSNHRRPVAPNVLDRAFHPESANRSWVADITYVPTEEGWLYLAAGGHRPGRGLSNPVDPARGPRGRLGGHSLRPLPSPPRRLPRPVRPKERSR